MGVNMRELGADYTAEFDNVDEQLWNQVIERFDDANIYQTWSYDEVRCGRDNISHLLLKKRGEIAAVAQARVVKIPFIRAGIAYVRWGPLWRGRNAEADTEIFRQAIRALRNEYACKRGLMLRLNPVLFRELSSPFLAVLAEEGFSSGKEVVDRTLRLDLRRPLGDLRKGLRPHWHRYLKVAEKNGLEIIEGSDDKLFEAFIGIYGELVGRKKFVEPNDIKEFRAIQGRLPDKFKMKIMLCKAGDELCAGLVCSAIGKTGIYLYGATSNVGLKKRGSYLLHWKLIEWLSQNGVETYDLHGINPVTNPGTYKFKVDLCGTNGSDVHFLGRFDSYTNVVSYLCVTCGDNVRSLQRTIKNRIADTSPRAPAQEPAEPGSNINSQTAKAAQNAN
jgi:peptidoglycan pentaglycine glycine transferase (the first glycine)